jgi:ABC-type nitrate/sulfonate/bicarbonate transport system permease component
MTGLAGFFLCILHRYIKPGWETIVPILIHPTEPLCEGASLPEISSISFQRVLIGFLFGVVIAVPMGLLYGWTRSAEEYKYPIIEILRQVPPIHFSNRSSIALSISQ